MTYYIAHVISTDAQTNKQTDKQANKHGKHKTTLGPAVRALWLVESTRSDFRGSTVSWECMPPDPLV